MEIEYLWDTNTVIYYLQKQFPLLVELFIDKILEYYRPAISIITEIELLCWNTPSADDMEILQDFIFKNTVINLESDIKYKAVEIRKSYKTPRCYNCCDSNVV